MSLRVPLAMSTITMYMCGSFLLKILLRRNFLNLLSMVSLRVPSNPRRQAHLYAYRVGMSHIRMAAAELTAVDIINANLYLHYRKMLRKIPRWRAAQPNIFIDYEIRPANHDDFYVPEKLKESAIVTRWTFSERGCNSMSCYPFHETGPIDRNTGADFTQTSDVAIAYAQPACYHLDRASAMREGAENEVQSPELRFAAGKCILVDSMSKVYLNTPYIRTDDHLISGVDDVPGFNVTPSDNPLFPEKFDGAFNAAYCRRFGRSLVNGGCSMRAWESLIGFVLGDTIYITMKLLLNNVFSELRSFDYRRPSPELPLPPRVDSTAVLREWRQLRDPKADIEFEKLFTDMLTLDEIGLDSSTKLIYRAEQGFIREPFTRNLKYRTVNDDADKSDRRRHVDIRTATDAQLNDIVAQFLEDNSFLLGILVSYGFDELLDGIKALLNRINSQLIPVMKRAMLNTSRRITTRMLGETYKASVTQAFSRIAIQTISHIAKAMTRIAMKAASVVGIILIIISIADLILGFWDPFGYNNMFPREFPEDLSSSFLTAYFDGINGGTRDLVEFVPDFYDHLLGEELVNVLDATDTLDYIASLTVNANGQLLEFEDEEEITDFDEVTLVGTALSSSALYTYLDFMQFTERHNKILLDTRQTWFVAPVLFIAGALILMLMPERNTSIVALFVIFLLIALYLMIQDSLYYYFGLRAHTYRLQTRWFDNLYDDIV
ncbi:P74 [Alphabaculovirus myunipunctae]|uniref:P74 n=1 Tax=Mythimna unipuncta nucleopolyhedrovirus TaxID=447897 RepID=A0A2K9VSJ2_9ABAC|nr:P74 [Mythimna unipuncta nucleopolyhedrovirus]AUV65406.1 P74 [Mythimna unipuncta nucleopolyhedrovirus]